jgi:hypothetical protein
VKFFPALLLFWTLKTFVEPREYILKLWIFFENDVFLIGDQVHIYFPKKIIKLINIYKRKFSKKNGTPRRFVEMSWHMFYLVNTFLKSHESILFNPWIVSPLHYYFEISKKIEHHEYILKLWFLSNHIFF